MFRIKALFMPMKSSISSMARGRSPDIRDAVSAEFGPIPLDIVSDYLNACEEAKIIAFR